MRGSRVPDAKRAEAVGLALVKGVPAASKATGIPQRSIREWRNDPEFAELRLSAREEVAEAMWVTIQRGLNEVYRSLAKPEETLKAKAETLFGLIDKHQLLTGNATSRSENRDITNLYDDHELDLLSRAIERQRAVESGQEASVEGGSPPESTGT